MVMSLWSTTAFAVDATDTQQYTITYDANGGEDAPEAQLKTEGEPLTLSTQEPTNPSNPYYVFAGWLTTQPSSVGSIAPDGTPSATYDYLPGDEITEDADITLYAMWAIPYGRVDLRAESPEYKDDDGNMSHSLWAIYGTDSGYEFGTEVVLDLDDEVNNVHELDVPGYNFVGWATTPDATEAEYAYGDTYIINQPDTTFYGVWKEIPVQETVSITFDPNGGKWSNNTTAAFIMKVIKGEVPVTPTAPTKADDDTMHYVFEKWEPEITAAESDATYTAVYTATPKDQVSYLITWKNADGTVLGTNYAYAGKMPTPAVAAPEQKPDSQFTYKFAGWEPEITAATKDTAYTAKYEKTLRTYTITWIGENGKVLRKDDLQYGATPDYGTNLPTKADDADYSYKFTGWTPIIEKVSKDQTYTASFAKTARTGYTVKWVNYDGTELEVDYNVPFGTVPTYNGPTPKKGSTTNYYFKFTNWTPAVVAVSQDTTYTAVFQTYDNKTGAPSTGDTSNVGLWIGIMVVCVSAMGGMGAYYVISKKKKAVFDGVNTNTNQQ